MPQTQLPQAVDAMQTADNTADGRRSQGTGVGAAGRLFGLWFGLLGVLSARCRVVGLEVEWACLGHNLYGGAFTPGAQT